MEARYWIILFLTAIVFLLAGIKLLVILGVGGL